MTPRDYIKKKVYNIELRTHTRRHGAHVNPVRRGLQNVFTIKTYTYYVYDNYYWERHSITNNSLHAPEPAVLEIK